MPARKNWIELLTTKSREDKATNLTINNIPIIECKKIGNKQYCNFLCSCGEEGTKKIELVYRNNRGLFCKECTSKNKTNKLKETYKNKTGYDNPSQNPDVKKQKEDTCLKNWGCSNSFQSQTIKDRIKATNLETIGVENPQQSKNVRDKTKKTNLERYGTEYTLQNEEVFLKHQKSRWKPKPYPFKTGETIKCQGYEPYALKNLEQNYNYTYDDYMNEPVEEFWYDTNDGKKHRYHKGGDIPFLRENKIIEVKSDYTFYADFYVNLLKAQCVLEKGFGFEFWVYDKNKELSIMDSKLLTNKFIVNCELLDHFKSSRV
jgi:hypothetical protein